MIAAAHAVPGTARELSAPPLAAGARVDVCIVGAGLAGLVAAYLLAREKLSVMLVDEGPIGGASGGTEVAHLGNRLEHTFASMQRLHGEGRARLAARGCAAAIDWLQAIVKRERIACEFERLEGFGFPAPGSPPATVELEAASARRAGMEAAEAATITLGADPQRCVRYPGHASFHPHKLLAGLASAVAREGGRIHCGVRTRRLAPDATTLVTAAGHRIEAGAIVSQSMREPGPRIAHAVGVRIPRGSLAPALYWEDAAPARCARLRSVGTGAGEVLLAAGEDSIASVEAWARRRFPLAGETVQRFTCELPRTADRFEFTGCAGNEGETVVASAAPWGSVAARAMVAGMAIRDLVGGSPTPWAELYEDAEAVTPAKAGMTE